MEDQCKFCHNQRWVTVTMNCIPPHNDFGGVMPADVACPLCNHNGEQGWGDDLLYYTATAIGGFEGKLAVWYKYQDGELLNTYIMERAIYDFSEWQPPVLLDDCPVCRGWGIWSHNGHIQDCLACGGQPIEARCGYEPLYAFWVNWKLGHTELLTPRGTGSLNDLVESRLAEPTVTSALTVAVESVPGWTRVQ